MSETRREDSPPERIWLQPDSPDFRRDTTWCWHPLDVEGEVEYVRYDFVADRIEELERENKRWIRSAFLESQRENKRLLEKILPSCTDEGGTSNE